MESTNKKYRNNNELSIVDLLCSAGYLPPRNEQDIERFERIYRGRIFETEAYTVNASAIFDMVTGEDKGNTRILRPTTTIFDHPEALRVADCTFDSYDDSITESFSQLSKNKKN